VLWPGIIVGADGITLNLRGHIVVGAPEPGEGAGILLQGRMTAKVTNGTVRDLDAGVLIDEGGDTTPLRPSRPLDSDAVPEVGTPRRKQRGRRQQSCRQLSGGGEVCDNDGIRLEPGVGPANLVKRNVVRGTGLDGVSVFADADKNTIADNIVESNGFVSAVAGDGIRIYGRRDAILRNRSFSNAGAGISVGVRTGSALGTLPNNATTGNPRGQYNEIRANQTSSNLVFDLWDGNPGCDANSWRNNTLRVCQPGLHHRLTPAGAEAAQRLRTQQ
jgi:hypothetical protein